ncbi:MAG: cyclodeaminase/cyclohydrolase family protein [bacterium]|nr:cyclodeaminase/cyclohydrolase family protein [bacterium]
MSNMPDQPAKLVYQPVAGFVEQIAAKSPAPGGGSAAALSGAIGAGLLVMVCEFTIGKKGFEAANEELTEVKVRIDALRHQLTTQVDLDTWAFSRFRVANRLPENTRRKGAQRARDIGVFPPDHRSAPADNVAMRVGACRCSGRGEQREPQYRV